MNGESIIYDKNVKRGVAAVLGILTVFLIVITVHAVQEFRFIGADVARVNTITVSGQGEVFAVPDIATISFTVREEGDDPATAQDFAAQKVNAALDYLDDQGIDEKDIKTTSFNAFPRYEYREVVCVQGSFCPPSGERELVGYEVSQTISVKVRDTNETGTILAGLTDQGIGSIFGPSFEIDEPETLERDARKMAIDDAEEKARELAKDLGVRIVRVVSFNESGGSRAFFDSAVVESFGVGGAEKATAPSVPTGENRISSNVSITYEIR